MKDSEKHLETLYSRLAEYLQSHKEAILNEWVAQVSRDSDVPTDPLTKTEIIDHVPQIFDAIVQTLLQHGSSAATADADKNIVRHTIIRWVQDYNLEALLREISLLRTELIRCLRVFEDEQQDFGKDAHAFMSTTVHINFDEIVLDATETFLKLKMRADADEV